MFDRDKIQALYPGVEDLLAPAMLIWKLPKGKESMMSEVCENGQYFAEEKIDGLLYVYYKGTEGQGYLFARTISKKTGLLVEKGANVPHIMQALDCFPNSSIVIGEIYFDGCTAKDCVSIMGCLPEEAIKRQESGRGKIKFYLHDIVRYDGINLMTTGAWDRYRILRALWEKYNLDDYPFLRLAEAVEENIEDEVSRILAAGGEGMVLKKRDGLYYPGRRLAWNSIKVKQMDDIDLVCTRTIPATREYTGKELETWPYWERRNTGLGERFIALTCMYNNQEEGWEPVTRPYALGWHTSIGIGAYDDDGKLVELGTVSSGLTDEDRSGMGNNSDDYIGKVVSLHCMSIDRASRSLRHPVFKSWRPDKNPQDCKLSEVFR